MRKNQKSFKLVIFIVFIILIISVSIGYGLLHEDIIITGKASLNITETPPPAQENHIITYVINDKWHSNNKYHYRITVTLFNNTNEDINGWTLTSNAPINAMLLHFANTSAKLKGKTLEFKNLSYNAVIPAKNSINFEFQISTTDENYQMGDFTVNGGAIAPDVPDKTERTAEINFVKDNSWESEGYTYYQFTCNIKNSGTAMINSWKFDGSLFKEASITQIWNANYIQNSETSITFEGTGYNGQIDVGGVKSFGMIIKSKFKVLEIKVINTTLN